MKTIGYAIIVSDPDAGDDAKSLVEEVMKLIRKDEGWEPIGGITPIATPGGTRIAQVIVRKVAG